MASSPHDLAFQIFFGSMVKGTGQRQKIKIKKDFLDFQSGSTSSFISSSGNSRSFSLNLAKKERWANFSKRNNLTPSNHLFSHNEANSLQEVNLKCAALDGPFIYELDEI